MDTVYINTRGNKSTEIPYAYLTLEQRKQILEDYISLGIKETCKKWNIKDLTLHQLKYHRRDLLEAIEDEHFAKRGL